MKRRAFTLVELLVVIAIIGLLSTVAVLSLSNARKSARNAKRIADIRQLTKAFDLGLDANGQYPSSGGNVWICLTTVCTWNWSVPQSATVDSFFTPFIPKLTDPVAGASATTDSRTFNGYMYNGAAASYGGSPVIMYGLEPPASCGPGAHVATTADYVQCAVVLN
jgi:prepilin-type N-terminal cleavage/methylation domain-containing protein